MCTQICSGLHAPTHTRLRSHIHTHALARTRTHTCARTRRRAPAAPAAPPGPGARLQLAPVRAAAGVSELGWHVHRMGAQGLHLTGAGEPRSTGAVGALGVPKGSCWRQGARVAGAGAAGALLRPETTSIWSQKMYTGHWLRGAGMTLRGSGAGPRKSAAR